MYGHLCHIGVWTTSRVPLLVYVFAWEPLSIIIIAGNLEKLCGSWVKVSSASTMCQDMVIFWNNYSSRKCFPLHAVTNCHANPRNKDTSQIFCHSSVWFPTWYSCCFVYTVPRVSIEEEVVDFGSMSVGQSATAVLHVRNDSDVTTLFQVYTWSYSCIHTHCCSCIFNDTRSMQRGLWKLYNNYV